MFCAVGSFPFRTVEPTTGLTGLLVTDETGDSYKRMIDIPESSKEKMFEYVKNNYIEI